VLVADDDPLRLMYTSGTESRPKGVLLSSRSLIAQYVSCVIDGGMAAEDVELHALPRPRGRQAEPTLTWLPSMSRGSLFPPRKCAPVLAVGCGPA
jgi:acyl-CoA synthetase (AMP-forming)/AMP-acid ligase II